MDQRAQLQVGEAERRSSVPERRGGLLSLLVPIPPATITFHARAIVHPAGTLDLHAVAALAHVPIM